LAIIRRDPPRLVFGEQLGRRCPPRPILEISLLFAGKRQRKSSRGQIIRIHVSPPGMLSKVLNNHVCNLTHANLSDTNDMHAN
jgi:hypothetical protein